MQKISWEWSIPAKLSICLSSKPVEESFTCWRPLSVIWKSLFLLCVWSMVSQTGSGTDMARAIPQDPPGRPFAIASATWHAVRRLCWVAVGRGSQPGALKMEGAGQWRISWGTFVCRLGQRERGSKKGLRILKMSYTYIPNLPLKKRCYGPSLWLHHRKKLTAAACSHSRIIAQWWNSWGFRPPLPQEASTHILVNARLMTTAGREDCTFHLSFWNWVYSKECKP